MAGWPGFWRLEEPWTRTTVNSSVIEHQPKVRFSANVLWHQVKLVPGLDEGQHP